jgi:hypothetical protein
MAMTQTRTVTVATALGVPSPALGGQSPWMLVNLNVFRGGVGLITVFRNNGNVNATCQFSVLVCGQDPKLQAANVIQGQGQFPFGTIYGYHDTLKNLSVAAPSASFVNFNSSLAYPCTALALNVTAITAGADVSLSIITVVD